MDVEKKINNFIIFTRDFIKDYKNNSLTLPDSALIDYENILHKIGYMYVDNFPIEDYLGDLTLFVRGKRPELISEINYKVILILIQYCKKFFYRIYLRQPRLIFNKYDIYLIKEVLREISNKLKKLEEI